MGERLQQTSVSFPVRRSTGLKKVRGWGKEVGPPPAASCAAGTTVTVGAAFHWVPILITNASLLLFAEVGFMQCTLGNSAKPGKYS